MNAGTKRLRELLAQSDPFVVPGVGNALMARLVEEAGFDSIYLSGAAVANTVLGLPDVGIATVRDMVMVAEHVTEVTSLPLIADGDTGYGGVHNVDHTVRLYRRAGVAAIQLEDQEYPKRCGHFEGKRVVPVEEMLARIEAARRAGDDDILLIARTDALGVHGLEEAISRARRYGEAGADILFVEAASSVEDLRSIGTELGAWPLLANMVEFGKTPLLPAQELGNLGFSIVLYPGMLTRTVVKAARDMLAELAASGTSRSRLDSMASFQEVNALVGLDRTDAREQEIAEVVSLREESDRSSAGS